jgi:hypothetical protein
MGMHTRSEPAPALLGRQRERQALDSLKGFALRMRAAAGGPARRLSRIRETEAGAQQRDAYRGLFAQHWNADEAVKVVEDGIGNGGRPRWIDYRMTFGAGHELHLHVVARSDSDTGVFAYGIIRRGERFGLQIVGSLEPQSALNVLAIYEKQAVTTRQPYAGTLRNIARRHQRA